MASSLTSSSELLGSAAWAVALKYLYIMYWVLPILTVTVDSLFPILLAQLCWLPLTVDNEGQILEPFVK